MSDDDKDAGRLRCYACDAVLKPGKPGTTLGYFVRTEDSQLHVVGRECYDWIVKGAETGYQPPKGGPRLFLEQFVPLKDSN